VPCKKSLLWKTLRTLNRPRRARTVRGAVLVEIIQKLLGLDEGVMVRQGMLAWDQELLSAKGFKRVGRHSAYSI
jgi:hypothetical protein